MIDIGTVDRYRAMQKVFDSAVTNEQAALDSYFAAKKAREAAEADWNNAHDALVILAQSEKIIGVELQEAPVGSVAESKL